MVGFMRIGLSTYQMVKVEPVEMDALIRDGDIYLWPPRFDRHKRVHPEPRDGWCPFYYDNKVPLKMDTRDLLLGTFILISTITPMIMVWIINRIHQRERYEDRNERKKIADTLLTVNKRVAEDMADTNSKLDIVHGLVNSNMTTALQNEYDATVRELAMMREVIELKKINGFEPTAETLTAIQSTELKLNDLEPKLRARTKQ